MCEICEISRQAYYKKQSMRKREKIAGEFIANVVKQERTMQPREGGRKLHKRKKDFFAKHGVKIGRDRFFKVLSKHNLLLEPLERHPKTTNARHYLPKFTNKIKEIKVSHANQVWVSDITYINTAEGYLYLSLITDLYSRKIVGAHASDSLETQGCLKALEKSVKGITDKKSPIHHSDCGSQYCSHQYIEELNKHEIEVSMTEENHCYENAVAERLNGILKQEYGLRYHFKNKSQARLAIKQAISLYNNLRLHKSLGYKTPQSIYESKAA